MRQAAFGLHSGLRTLTSGWECRLGRRRRTARKVDGEHVLYHYLQKDLRERDVWLFQMLTARLMAELGI